jgi:hypothetical protein
MIAVTLLGAIVAWATQTHRRYQHVQRAENRLASRGCAIGVHYRISNRVPETFRRYCRSTRFIVVKTDGCEWLRSASQRQAEEFFRDVDTLAPKRLDFFSTQIGDIATTRLARLRVAEMVFRDGPVSQTLAEQIAGNCDLLQLTLNGSPITDQSLAVLSRLPRLEQLSVQGDLLTDGGLRYASYSTSLKILVVDEAWQINDRGRCILPATDVHARIHYEILRNPYRPHLEIHWDR